MSSAAPVASAPAAQQQKAKPAIPVAAKSSPPAAASAASGKSPSKEHSTRHHESSSSSSAAPVPAHEVRVSTTRPPHAYVDIALRLFLRHPLISIHGCGGSIASAIEVGQTLVHLGFGEIAKIETNSLVPPRGGTPKPEFRIDLKRLKMPHDDGSTAEEKQEEKKQ